jgi:hypothetical protein
MGATSWRVVALLAASNSPFDYQDFVAVSWDANGHPALVWSATMEGNLPNIQPVLEYHQA